MSKGPETTFYGSVHKKLPHGPSRPYFMKQNSPYMGGPADFWYSGKRDMWVEYKFLIQPKRPETLIDLCGAKMLSKLQQEWLEGRHHEGRKTHVIVGCAAGGVIFDGLSWKTPIIAARFNELMMNRQSIADWIVEQTS